MSRNNGNLTFSWSDRLEDLAAQLFALEPLTDPFAREYVVVFGRVTGSWLRHYFVYTYSRRPDAKRSVLANMEFQPLFVFVNDWLHRMHATAETQRRPRYFPYSVDCLQWRLFDLFQNPVSMTDPSLAELQGYLGDEPDPRRCFQLAGEIAQLLDQYVVYRPDMVLQWQSGQVDDRVPGWQPRLWRMLTDQDPESYLTQFRDMDRGALRHTEIEKAYARVTVFAVPTMPHVYLHFFARLAEFLPVRMLMFNPCRAYWQEDLSPRRAEELMLENLCTSEIPEAELYLEIGNPLLSGLGVAGRELLTAMLERDDLAHTEDDGHDVPRESRNTTLATLQSAIRERSAPDPVPPDNSLQIHICHSPAREIDVLCDHLFKWFDESKDLRPRDIQVQVTDLATYAPYIDAAFARRNRHASDAIPYAVADRAQLRTSLVAAAFLQLLELPESRFEADRIMDLLDCEAIHTTFGLDADQVAALRQIIRDAGITWGIDETHRAEQVTACYPQTSWRQGLDRILLGYAMGDSAGTIDSLTTIPAGALGDLQPFTEVEGGTVEAIGRFLRFHEQLVAWGKALTEDRPTQAWSDCLLDLIDTFFTSTGSTYRDIAALRQAARSLSRLANAANMERDLPLTVVSAFLKDEIERADAGDSLVGDAVVFSALRAGSSTPRRVVCLLGLNDGGFPRTDKRPAFDLLARGHRSCDPSLRLQDRYAFLEAVMAARERLYISYVGRSESSNEVMPPSPVVAELLDYVLQTDLVHRDEETRRPDCVTEHRLQAFHPAYFMGEEGCSLFSYSTANYASAQRLLTPVTEAGEEAETPASPSEPTDLSLDAWINYFCNPAKSFYRESLQANFDAASRPLLPDREMFSLGGLEKYSVDQELLELLKAQPDPDQASYVLPLQQRGAIPLGVPGAQEAETHVDEITEMLNRPIVSPCLPDSLTVRSLLQAQTQKLAISERLSSNFVEGELDVAQVAGRTMQVLCRYTRTKAKDKLRAWLRHLFLCRVNPDAVTIVIGKDKMDLIAIPPIPPERAGDILHDYERLMSESRQAPLPFAPASSLAWVEAGRKDESEIAAARKEWVSDGKKFGEDGDAFLAHAFGDEGPMAQGSFSDIAHTIFDPYLDHLNTDASPVTEDEA